MAKLTPKEQAKDAINKGTVFWYSGNTATVMAIDGHYAMARKRGAFPFVITVGEIKKALGK